ncbi:MAG: hypothetical protein Kow0062_08300 [Acidobacteriota bacterium]
MSRRSRARRRPRGRATPTGESLVVADREVPPRDRGEDLTADRAASYDRGTVPDSPADARRDDRSFGEMLRRERELRRISLREVNEATKINIRYLEALERNEFTYLPAGAFTRGFIRAYARYIGLDEGEMINAYLYELRRQEEAGDQAGDAPDEQLRAHFGLEEQEAARRRRFQRLLILLGASVLLLAALAMLAVFVVSQARGADAAPPMIEQRLP